MRIEVTVMNCSTNPYARVNVGRCIFIAVFYLGTTLVKIVSREWCAVDFKKKKERECV